MTASESEILAVLDYWSLAVRAKDIDRLMALYSPDIVYFDVVPPLQIAGTEAVRRNFLRWFGTWKSGIGSEARDLEVLASGDTAVAFKLHRTSGTLKNGREVDYYVRVTVCLRRSNDSWLITHEHVSLPVDMASGQVVMDLKP